MGLMLSVLIGCAGMLELLAWLRRVTDSVVITIDQPATPCLSYHETNDNASTHDSICSYSHSSDAKLPRGVRHKLENLHEYSLRIRAQLRSKDKNFDYGSECSFPGDYLLGSRLTPDSRFSPDFEYLVRESENEQADSRRLELENDYEKLEYEKFERETSYEDAETQRVENSSRDRPLSVTNPEPDKYFRVPTPIPIDVDDDEYAGSGASSDLGTSFDNDSGNEAPTKKSFEPIPGIDRYASPSGSSRDESDDRDNLFKKPFGKSRSRSPDPARSQRSSQFIDVERDQEGPPRGPSQRKRGGKSSSTIVRKPTRLKSKNAEVSKSAENLTSRKSKRHREPERRKSDISGATFRDEWTNTSPPGSPASLSRSESHKSVSVQVQTSFEEILARDEELDDSERFVVGLSESKRDLSSRDRFNRRSVFKNRRFGGSGSRDRVAENGSSDRSAVTNATASVEALKDTTRLLKISSFEEAEVDDYERIRDILATDIDAKEAEKRKGSRSVSSFDDEQDYWDAEDVSAGNAGPIQYTIPDPDRNKAFWVITSANEDPPVSFRAVLVVTHIL
ncbi:uncharacterized protein LOC128895862 [Hylaeus anthracinus]|uniref:uncharacterized protein LOC128895862 n=1 Tax=Hylaeus anthracinus TaxID=313031 RepID=UPI0023B9C314|nr:uncharacterized protein LOC128895862 [Hylaeus anthracinus]